MFEVASYVAAASISQVADIQGEQQTRQRTLLGGLQTGLQVLPLRFAEIPELALSHFKADACQALWSVKIQVVEIADIAQQSVLDEIPDPFLAQPFDVHGFAGGEMRQRAP